MTKKWLITYVISTSICLILDLISFFSRVHHFGKERSAFYDLSLTLIAVIFMFIDWYYVMWVLSLLYKFPTYLTAAIMKGILGMMDSIH